MMKHDFFGDGVMAGALIDRLLHCCHIVDIHGTSYRMRQRRNLATRLAETATTATTATPPARGTRRKETELPCPRAPSSVCPSARC